MEQVYEIIDMHEEGYIVTLDALLKLRTIRNQAEESIKLIKEWESEYAGHIRDDAYEYDGIYKGNKISVVQGRKLYNFKHITEWKEATDFIKEMEKHYRNAFNQYQKTNKRPKDENGNPIPLPEISYGKGYVKIEQDR